MASEIGEWAVKTKEQQGIYVNSALVVVAAAALFQKHLRFFLREKWNELMEKDEKQNWQRKIIKQSNF